MRYTGLFFCLIIIVNKGVSQGNLVTVDSTQININMIGVESRKVGQFISFRWYLSRVKKIDRLFSIENYSPEAFRIIGSGYPQ